MMDEIQRSRVAQENETYSSIGFLDLWKQRNAQNLHFALKLVSVKLSALGFVLPTFSFGFWKSFFFSFFLFALEPILSAAFE